MLSIPVVSRTGRVKGHPERKCAVLQQVLLCFSYYAKFPYVRHFKKFHHAHQVSTITLSIMYEIDFYLNFVLPKGTASVYSICLCASLCRRKFAVKILFLTQEYYIVSFVDWDVRSSICLSVCVCVCIVQLFILVCICDTCYISSETELMTWSLSRTSASLHVRLERLKSNYEYNKYSVESVT